MSYQGIARKWRPQSFQELVGQEAVSKTLLNALRADRVPHAMLFTGTRGVGKTSSARILAKALRCPQAKDFVPCNTCSDCEEIGAGKSVNVIEIDGASNNGVDAIRDLRDSVGYMPSSGKYKIYIIDEVHMLTTNAFNALLKTLEEPPGHVVFIFATTEVQKIPITVLSRCQRFDFRSISTSKISEHLKNICDTEKIKSEEEALWLIARQAAGSMRDGLSLLDQAVSFCDKDLKYEKLVEVLGLTDRQLIIDSLNAIARGNTENVFDVIEKVRSTGTDVKNFGEDLLEEIRNLLLIKIAPEEVQKKLLDLPQSEIDALVGLAKDFSAPEIHMLFDMALKTGNDIPKASNPILVLEMALLRMSSAPKISQLVSGDYSLAEVEKKKPLAKSVPDTQTSSVNSANNNVAVDTQTRASGSITNNSIAPETRDQQTRDSEAIKNNSVEAGARVPQNSVDIKPTTSKEAAASPEVKTDETTTTGNRTSSEVDNRSIHAVEDSPTTEARVASVAEEKSEPVSSKSYHGDKTKSGSLNSANSSQNEHLVAPQSNNSESNRPSVVIAEIENKAISSDKATSIPTTEASSTPTSAELNTKEQIDSKSVSALAGTSNKPTETQVSSKHNGAEPSHIEPSGAAKPSDLNENITDSGPTVQASSPKTPEVDNSTAGISRKIEIGFLNDLSLQDNWHRFATYAKGKVPILAAKLDHCVAISLEASKLRLGIRKRQDFLRQQLMDDKSLLKLQKLMIQSGWCESIETIEYVSIEDSREDMILSPAEITEKQKNSAKEELQKRIKENPLIQKTMKTFDARITSIREIK